MSFTLPRLNIFINLMQGTIPTLVSVAVFAQPVTMKSFQENSVGRIFLTPEQRLLIDRVSLTSSTSSGSSAKNESDTGPATKAIHGVVRRSDGHTVIWVNGKMQLHAN
jgi:hypothetical protein